MRIFAIRYYESVVHVFEKNYLNCRIFFSVYENMRIFPLRCMYYINQ